MQAFVWEAPRVMRAQTLPDPTPGPGELAIRVEAVGICGSELEGYLGRNSLRRPPLVMGHEFCGRVVALGPGVTEPAIGTRVTVNPLYGCRRCPACARGENHLCPARVLIGAHRPGAFAEYVAVPARSVYPLPDALPPELGALCEPAAVCFHALRRAGLAAGERLIVWGAGALGAMALQVAKSVGAWVGVVDVQPARLAALAHLGADAVYDARQVDFAAMGQDPRQAADVVFECVGRSESRRAAATALRRGGRLLLLGLHDPETAMPWNDLIRQELTLYGSFAYAEADFRQAVEWVKVGGLGAGSWLTRRPWGEGPEWFARLTVDPSEVTKIVLMA